MTATNPGPETTPRFADIKWPDPPAWDAFLDIIKRYVFPAVKRGLEGYVVGGLPGAVAGGGSSLIETAVSDLNARDEAKKKKQADEALLPEIGPQ